MPIGSCAVEASFKMVSRSSESSVLRRDIAVFQSVSNPDYETKYEKDFEICWKFRKPNLSAKLAEAGLPTSENMTNRMPAFFRASTTYNHTRSIELV
jgi:hypothetical protein